MSYFLCFPCWHDANHVRCEGMGCNCDCRRNTTWQHTDRAGAGAAEGHGDE